jgi:hypothetical protein
MALVVTNQMNDILIYTDPAGIRTMVLANVASPGSAMYRFDGTKFNVYRSGKSTTISFYINRFHLPLNYQTNVSVQATRCSVVATPQ